MYMSAPQAMVMMAELGMRDPQRVMSRVDWQGKEIIDELQRNNEKGHLFSAARPGRGYSGDADGFGWAKKWRRCSITGESGI